MLGNHALGPLGILEGCGAQVDASGVEGQNPLEGFVVTDTAGHLDLHLDPLGHATQHVDVVTATERRVQVHQVQPFRPGLLPHECGVHGIAVPGFGTGLTLNETHGLAVLHVHGGQQFQTGVVS